MKNTITALLLMAFGVAGAQVKLDDKDLTNLIAISEICHKDPNANTKDFDKSLNKLRTPKLNPVIDVLVLLDGSNKSLLTPKYLTRPDNDVMQLWYVMDQISDNMQESNTDPRPNETVAKEALASSIDERWLVNNYYSNLYSGLAFMFNDKNLSSINFDIESYKLKDKTEKAIFFFCITKPLLQRFQVLNQMKIPDKLLEFAGKMPKFNGKDYYYFTDFDFEDFEFVYPDTTSYTAENLSQYYGSLMSHFMAAAEKEKIYLAREIYFSSILYKPEYFKFSGAEDDLKAIYEDFNK